jgi:hypothetical protein
LPAKAVGKRIVDYESNYCLLSLIIRRKHKELLKHLGFATNLTIKHLFVV